jgi:hypothetical protein
LSLHARMTVSASTAARNSSKRSQQSCRHVPELGRPALPVAPVPPLKNGKKFHKSNLRLAISLPTSGSVKKRGLPTNFLPDSVSTKVLVAASAMPLDNTRLVSKHPQSWATGLSKRLLSVHKDRTDESEARRLNATRRLVYEIKFDGYRALALRAAAKREYCRGTKKISVRNSQK